MWGENLNIIIVGGDKRQTVLYKNLCALGHNVLHCLCEEVYQKYIDSFEVVILPLPTTRNNITVRNDLSDDLIRLDVIEKSITKQKVLCANYSFKNIQSTDYAQNDALALLNAVPTAEGAIALAVNNSDITLWKSNCLVVGFGRTGKILADRLNSLKANVTVSARKMNDFALIDTANLMHIETTDIKKHISKYDFIFNTVAFPIIDRTSLELCKKDCLLIELASAPYGIDLNSAKEIGIKSILAPGIPGKTAYITAGNILTEIILKLI